MKTNIFIPLIGIVFTLCSCNNEKEVNEDIKDSLTEALKRGNTVLSVKKACSFSNEIVDKDVYTFESDNDAEVAVNKIMKVTGLPSNFKIMAANVDNAAATIICSKDTNCVRYILYNQEFMQLVKDSTHTNFGEISILAHEIGHHLSGHTILEKGNSHDHELEADKFSGFVLYKMGATLAEAQISIKKLCSEAGSDSHPPKSARLAAITNGWYEAKNADKNPRNSSTQVLNQSTGNTKPDNTESLNSNRSNSVLKDIKSMIENYSFQLMGMEGKKVKIRYNAETRILILDGFVLNLNQLDVLLDYKMGNYVVSFACPSDGQCIRDSDGEYHIAFSIPFPNKRKCNEFMTLIEKL